MILGNRSHSPANIERGSTLDDLFRHAAEKRPDSLALLDPPDRQSFTDRTARRLTYAQADQAINALAERLTNFGFSDGAVVAVQLPNTVESILTLLGVLRAGLIASPIPLLWRHAEITPALARIGARALIACQRVGSTDHGEIAMQVAADTFAIRFVGGFGQKLPDGVIPLDDIFEETASTAPTLERSGNPADHLAVVTWDVTPDGVIPVARSHAELIAGGHAVYGEAQIAPNASILAAMPTWSFAGLASVLVPWLLSGGTLSLHHPFSPAIFDTQCSSNRCETIILPGPVATRMQEAGLIGAVRGQKSIIALWRAPERMGSASPWIDAVPLIDVTAFGEVGLVAIRRGAKGLPAQIPVGTISTSNGSGDPMRVIEVARSATGSIALRGPMVPHYTFPPGIERSSGIRLKIADDGFIDTGYGCRLDNETKMLTIDRPPPGVISIGGYRFLLRELQNVIATLDKHGSVTALPDMLNGNRLGGLGDDRYAIYDALIEMGANPLLIGAFSDRRLERASAA
ncbi:MAG TPA: class I adenylate-forming enzyme family protein [Xanthobacteraceae bacterium]|nr:class I adenylate-forming enzyme family protein [Xanthobacteraceae bacterium]